MAHARLAGAMAGWVRLALCAVLLSCTPGYAVATCSTKTLSVAVADADTFLQPFGGRSWGETFLATDTIITSVSVWLAVKPTVGWGHLFVTDVDSSGTPDVLFAHVLLDGPVLLPPAGDGIHPTEFRFALDPPFALPGRGQFFFSVEANDCFSSFSLLADTQNAYPRGAAWHTVPTTDCNNLGGARASLPGTDLVFEIEFCDTMTSTRHPTWGEMKVRYR